MLFETKDIDSELPVAPTSWAKSVSVSLMERVVLGKRNEAVERVFPELLPETATAYVSAGAWSMHDLLFHFLAMTGPAKVYFATWTMTESPCRMLIAGLESGLITELLGLVDVRVKVRNPAIFAFAKMNMTKVREAVCHAKVTVIENDDWAISVVGSPNFTNNPRIEAGVVFVSRKMADFQRKWIEDEINNAKPFEV